MKHALSKKEVKKLFNPYGNYNGKVGECPRKQGGIAHFLIGAGLIDRAKLRQFFVGNLVVFA